MKMLRRFWNRLAAETHGAEIAEAAVVLPLVFMLLLGIYWFGRAYNIYATVSHAAREGARVAVVSSCATCGDSPTSRTEIADRVAQALLASKLDPTKVTRVPPLNCACGDPNCSGGPVPCESVAPGEPQVCIQHNIALNGPTAASACGVAVSFEYPYQFYLPFTSLSNQQISLKAYSEMAGEE